MSYDTWRERYILSEPKKGEKIGIRRALGASIEKGRKKQKIESKEEPEPSPKLSRPIRMRGEKPNRKKITIIVATAVIVIIVLWIVFAYSPILKPETIETETSKLTIYDVPFEKVFHLRHGDSVKYHFNVSLIHRIEIEVYPEVWQEDGKVKGKIDFKLYDYAKGTTKIEREWVIAVTVTPLLNSGIWVAEISAPYSDVDGRIYVSKGFMYSYEFVHMFAVRDGTNISMNYEDELQETVLVYLSIMDKSLVEIWNYTESGPERNKFSLTWQGADKFTDYVVDITAEHRVFGNLTYRNIFPGEFRPYP